jgi:predicted nucleotidyltransferase component of viral defense system
MDEISSIKARIKDIAKKTNRDNDALLLQFFQERFLYRLSISDYKENFILKGGLLLLVQEISRFRPTKDMDFLGSGITNNEQNLKSIISKIISIPSDDHVLFLKDSIETSRIKEDADYEGIRCKITAKLGNIKKKVILDIGFGDVIIPEAKEFDFPVILDFSHPIIKAYSFETVIAEKFQAIVWLNYQTSRMKDFFDIYYLIQNCKINYTILSSAIQETFRHRQTDLKNIRIIFSSDYINNKDKAIQWDAFVKKNKLNAPTFSEILENIKNVLTPIIKQQ